MPRISALTALTSADGADTIPILDVSATTTKKITKTALISDIVDGTLLADNSIQSRHIDWADTGGGDNGGIWWEELGRTTLGSAGDTISVASFSARKYLQIRVSALASGAITCTMRFNNDSGNNYARNDVTNGAITVATVNTNNITVDIDAGTVSKFITGDIINISGTPKLFYGAAVSENVSGAGTNPNQRIIAGKWQNTSAQITRIDIINTAGGDFAIGSEVVILGHD